MERKLLVGLAMAALTACGGSTPATPDSGTRDTGTPAADTGTPAADTGTPAADTGTPEVDGGSAVDCNTYCTLNLATCADQEPQYVDMAACLGSCAAFDVGTAADTDVNTLGCRLYHTMAAATTPDSQHCLHAGPAGYELCGTSQCEAFCQIAESACTGANEQWATTAECMTDCEAYAGSTPGEPAGAPDYSTAETAGNSFACRLYHLTVASSTPALAAVHCGHIIAASPTCAD